MPFVLDSSQRSLIPVLPFKYECDIQMINDALMIMNM